MKILLIQLRQLGDILLTTPVIRAVRLAYPEATISFLSHPMGKLILKDNSQLDEHIVMPASGLIAQMRAFKSLRDRKFDLVFDFMGNPRSALSCFITGAPKRIGFNSPRAWAYNDVVDRLSGDDYIVYEKFRMLAKAGVSANDIRLMLAWDESDVSVSDAFFAENSLSNHSTRRVCLSPTHRRPNRKWGVDRWAALADWIVGTGLGDVFWLWGPGEESEVLELKNQCREKTYMAPKTNFRELAAFIAQCDFFIGNSNGPSHVAVAVNTPSLQLHGHTDAPSWCPQTARHKAIQGPKSMDISLAEVQKEFKSLIDQTTTSIPSNAIRSSDAVWTVRPLL